MKLNENDFNYFKSAIQTINFREMTKSEAMQELKMSLGNYANGICKMINRGESRELTLNVLLEVHDEYEAILDKLDEIEGEIVNEKLQR